VGKAAKSQERGPENDGQNTPAANQALMAINISFYIILFLFAPARHASEPRRSCLPGVKTKRRLNGNQQGDREEQAQNKGPEQQTVGRTRDQTDRISDAIDEDKADKGIRLGD